MSNITNKTKNPIVVGSTVVPAEGVANVEDWDELKDRASIKAIIKGGGLVEGGKVTEAEPEAPETADAAPQGRRAVRG